MDQLKYFVVAHVRAVGGGSEQTVRTFEVTRQYPITGIVDIYAMETEIQRDYSLKEVTIVSWRQFEV